MRLALSLLVFALLPGSTFAEDVRLAYRPAPADNPLKGLVPYRGEQQFDFPHSMEFSYLAVNDVIVDKNRYDWAKADKLLQEIGGRGHQAIIRFYLEYPGKKSGVPQYLINEGLQLRPYKKKNKKSGRKPADASPDYENTGLRQCLQRFIVAFGARYDGDARLGFITAGLLGRWGEWHTYPDEQYWASKAVQTEIMHAYQQAFSKTPILLRYPAGNNDDRYAPNAAGPFGYHDDSFALATLHTGKKGDEWFFETLTRHAGPEAQEKWKSHPIGGEISPEVWGKVFDHPVKDAKVQDFESCVTATHASWVMDSGLFEKRTYTPERHRRAEPLVRRLGYEFYVSKAEWSIDTGKLSVAVHVSNKGIAPFYYPWAVEFVLLSESGRVVARQPIEADIRKVMPDGSSTVWSVAKPIELPVGRSTVAIHVINPLKGGKPLRFANQTQDNDLPGTLSLFDVER